MKGETADLIGEGYALLGLRGVTPVKAGDVFVSCVHEPSDLWVIFPIATAAGGLVQMVVDGDGTWTPWRTEFVGADAAKRALAAIRVAA